MVLLLSVPSVSENGNGLLCTTSCYVPSLAAMYLLQAPCLDQGWHHSINRVAKTNSINMYLLISVLHDESSWIPLIVKLVKQKMYRYQRKHAIQKPVNLDDLWMKYENKSITTSEFLNWCTELMDHAVSSQCTVCWILLILVIDKC